MIREVTTQFRLEIINNEGCLGMSEPIDSFVEADERADELLDKKEAMTVAIIEEVTTRTVIVVQRSFHFLYK